LVINGLSFKILNIILSTRKILPSLIVQTAENKIWCLHKSLSFPHSLDRQRWCKWTLHLFQFQFFLVSIIIPLHIHQKTSNFLRTKMNGEGVEVSATPNCMWMWSILSSSSAHYQISHFSTIQCSSSSPRRSHPSLSVPTARCHFHCHRHKLSI
jgi:hypothetical protein